MIYVLSLYIFIEKINLNTQFGLTENSVIFAYILTLKLFSYYQKLLDVFSYYITVTLTLSLSSESISW